MKTVTNTKKRREPMAGTIRARFANGVLEPLERLDVPEGEVLTITIRGRKRLAAIRCKKMPLHRTGRDHMAAHERPPSLTPGSRHVFPQIGRTGTYPPECPSSRRWGSQF